MIYSLFNYLSILMGNESANKIIKTSLRSQVSEKEAEILNTLIKKFISHLEKEGISPKKAIDFSYVVEEVVHLPASEEEEKVKLLLDFIKNFPSKFSVSDKFSCMIECMATSITNHEETFYMAFIEAGLKERCGFCESEANLLLLIREISASPLSNANKNKLYLQIATEGFEKNVGFIETLGNFCDLISWLIPKTLEIPELVKKEFTIKVIRSNEIRLLWCFCTSIR